MANTVALVSRPRFLLTAAFLVVSGLAWPLLSLVWPDVPVRVHVRWKADVSETQRGELERRFQLTDRDPIEGTTSAYRLSDASPANIRAIVQDARVDDTAHLNRVRFRPEFAMDRSRKIIVGSLTMGAIGSVLLVLVSARQRPQRGQTARL